MTAQVNGIRLHADTAGEGPPLVLLHGFTGSGRSWDRFIPSWSSHFRTIAVDLIGHGQSEAPDDPSRYSMEHVVQDLAALLDQLEVGEASVLGYSMGGRLALSFAVLQPERVRALVLESASPGLRTEEEREARRNRDGQLADRIEREGIERFAEDWENLPLFESVKRLPQEDQLRIRRQRLLNRPSGLANSLRGMGTGAQPSWWDRLHTLPMPALLLAGALDGKFHRIAGEMAALIPNASFVPVPDAGHMIHVEQAGIIDTIVRDYLLSV
jgi:2-succinyl-6-hydroxy-2,4-cyclohexadiene-1-carboxylate synthase